MATAEEDNFEGPILDLERRIESLSGMGEDAAVQAQREHLKRELDAVLVFTDDGPLGMPCGICRQTLVEFAGPTCAVVVASPRESKLTTLGALLPEPFTLRG